jgi:3D (Asp-Asp-Asp) domain-containing protein
MNKKDKKIFNHVLVVAMFICVTIASFFIYDIVLDAKTADEKAEDSPESVPDIIIDVTEPVYREPEKIVVSDKIVYLAHLTADRKDYTFPFLVEDNATVADLLERAGVTVSKDDYINKGYTPETPLFEDIYVEIGRVEYKEVVEKVSIPFKTIEMPMIYSIWAGKKVKDNEKGENGVKEITYRIKYVDGVEVSSSKISEKVTKKPVTAKVYVDRTDLLDLRNGPPSEYITVVDVNVTAYTGVEEGGLITATGDPTQVGYVAVDSTVIPLYSKLYIVLNNGFVYGYCTAMDVGGGIKGNDIDIFLPDYDDMMNFGRKAGKCYIISYGKGN